MKKWLSAPASDCQVASGSVLGVSILPGERVQWAYTILPDGRRIVTGYDILPVANTIKTLMKKINQPAHKKPV